MNKKLFLVLLSIIIFSLSSISFAQNKDSSASSKTPKRISGGVINGKAVSLPKPVYPVEAKEANISGSVNVQIVIDRAGHIISAKAVSGHPLLRNVAVEAAKLAKFQPTLLEGSPVEVSGVIVYNFLNSNEDNSKIEQVAPKKRPEVSGVGFGTDKELVFLDEEKQVEPDDKIGIFILSTFLSAHKYIGKEKEYEKIVIEMIEIVPLFINKSNEYKDFANKSFEEQKQIIIKLQNILQKDLDTSEKWHYQTGALLGQIMGQFGNFEKDLKLIKKDDLQILLIKIKDLTYSAPQGLPKPFIEGLKKISNYSSHKDLGSIETQKKIFRTISELF